MPIAVTCPTCQRSFNAPDSAAGKNARCPQCGGVIAIPGLTPDAAAVPQQSVAPKETIAPVPIEHFGEPLGDAAVANPRKPCPMCGESIAADAVKCRYCGEVFDATLARTLGGAGNVRDPAWRTVRSGLSTLYYSVAAILLAFILLIVAGAIGAAMEAGGGRDAPESPVFIVFAVISVIIILGAGVGILVGLVLCTNVPSVSGARGFAIGATLCFVAIIIASLVAGAAGQRGNPVGNLLSFAGYILFALFIRRAASYLGDQKLATSAGRFLIFGVVVFVVVFTVVLAAVLAQAFILLGIAGLLAFVLFIVAFIWYLRLIVSLRKAIDHRMAAG